ncbi:MAG: aldo/keto reductase, partial [Mesorhizobium sp.]
QKDGVTAPIVGVSKLSHVEAALKAIDIKLTDNEIAAIERPYRPRTVSGF